MYCPKCGTESSANFCPNCGYALNSQNDALQGQGNSFRNQQGPNFNNQNFGNQQANPYSQQLKQTCPRGKMTNSPLSLVSVLLSITGVFSIVGIILAIVDIKKDKYKEFKHNLSFLAIGAGVFMLIFILPRVGKDNNTEAEPKTSVSNVVTTEENTNKNTTILKNDESQSNANADPGIPVASDYKKMNIGEIGIKGDVYVGLSYVKRMSYLPTALGEHSDITAGHEVILAFFDFYNNADKNAKVYPGDITCYADGVQIEGVKNNYINIECDGVEQYGTEELADHTQLISVQDFEVATGWKELKFFYKSELAWTISQDEVKTDNFSFSSMYGDLAVSRSITPEETVIFNDDYKITFKGISDYTHKNVVWGDKPYVIFKFAVENTGSTPIDYSLAGYEMTAYINNYFAGDASFALDEKIDGYSNIYNIDSIEAGMSANIYLAFEGSAKDATLYMIYDDGYITNKVRGSVYVEQ